MKNLLLSLLMVMPLYLSAQTHYKIYSSTEHKIITLDELVAHMTNADVLFFGEEHNDTVQHTAELTLLQKLNTICQGRLALSLEMFETDVQPVLNEYLNGQITEKFLLSDARAWPNYTTDYRPLVELAKTSHLMVIAANAPGRYVNLVNRKGLAALQQLNPQARAVLPPLPIDTATGSYYNKFSQLMGGHGSMEGMQLYQAQNVWDATMGWSIANFYKNHPGTKILHINGGFHSEEKLGTVAQLKHYAPNARILTIAASADAHFTNPDWNQYAGKGDFILITDYKTDKE